MPVTLDIAYPEDNELDLAPDFLRDSDAHVTVLGRGNRLTVERPLRPNTARFLLGGGSSVTVRMDSNLNDLNVHALDGACIDIGSWCSFTGQCQITAHEFSTVSIGTQCLFGSATRIASSDVHKIVDRDSGTRLNPAGDIIIGDRVWVAPDCLILRNSIIGCGSIVGAKSVVRNAFPAHVLLAGAPARIARHDITWEF